MAPFSRRHGATPQRWRWVAEALGSRGGWCLRRPAAPAQAAPEMNALDTALDTASAVEVPGHWRRACRVGELGAARTCPTRVPRMGGHARPRLHPACEWQRKTGARREVAHGGGGGGLADSATGVVPFIYSSSDFHVFFHVSRALAPHCLQNLAPSSPCAGALSNRRADAPSDALQIHRQCRHLRAGAASGRQRNASKTSAASLVAGFGCSA